uniref:Secreted protein n=1 Tax=Anopheles atroparvus TaxID=41427 RepID=A0A182IP42_ANOAO
MSRKMCAYGGGLLWHSVLVTLTCASLLGAGVSGSREERDDVTVEEMLRRDSRAAKPEQPEYGGQLTGEEHGNDAEEVMLVGHSVRHRQPRTKQLWRATHRTRHAGRQGERQTENSERLQRRGVL